MTCERHKMADKFRPGGRVVNAPASHPALFRERNDVHHAEKDNNSCSSSYYLANDSQLSGDIDRWLGINTRTESDVGNRRPIQGTARSPELTASGIGYILAVLMPLMNMNAISYWCTPSYVLKTTQMVMVWICRSRDRLWEHCRKFAQDPIMAREIFAAVIDCTLVVYAIGFLCISMYQSSMLG